MKRKKKKKEKSEEATAKQYVNCCRTNKMNFDGFAFCSFFSRLSSLRQCLHLPLISNQAYRTIILFVCARAHSIFSSEIYFDGMKPQ